MTIINNLKEFNEKLRNPVLTIGNFDGVHKGHLALFDKVKERSTALDGTSAVMTFDPHPIKIMNPENAPPLITPIQQKLKLIREAGMNLIFCIPFTREFAQISAQEFVENILVKKIGIRELVVGYDYTFGRKREGNIELLRRLGQEMGFKVHVMEPVHVDGTLVSSTSIRKLVQEGNLAEAKKLLGRDYEIAGTVVKGKNIGGRVLGFPTANLKLIDELTPKKGVYAVKVLWNGKTYPGVTNIGYNPTFGKGAFSVETHILGFSGDLLGKLIRIQFIERLRDEKTFEGPKDLALQIKQDIETAKKFLL